MLRQVNAWCWRPRRQQRKRLGACRALRCLAIEWLEDRTLFSAGPLAAAVPLSFDAQNVAEVQQYQSRPSAVELYQLALQAGDTIEAGIAAQDAGNQAGAGFRFPFPGFNNQGASAFRGLLRVFGADGTPLALDDQQGGDPSLTFQAATGGVYFLGVSSSPNDHYDPNVAGSGTSGGTTGLFTLGVRRLTGGPLQSDLTGSSFRTGADLAAPGDTVPVHFIVEDRGGADPGAFQVQVLLANTSVFDNSPQVLATLQRADLIADSMGRDFAAPSGLRVTIPTTAASGPMFVGLRIVADPAVPDARLSDKSGVHRGVDWEPLTLVTRAAAGATDLSQIDAGLRTETAGVVGSGRSAAYSFTVGSALGDGELTAEVAPSTAADGPGQYRLTLTGTAGQLLIQSDSGRLVQALQPGTYRLTVSALAGTGAYQVTTAFVQTGQPFAALPTGAGPASVTVADVNNDGIPDIITANRIDQTVSVFLGNGDGTFQRPMTYAAGPRIWRITVADVNNDGKPDILTGNKGNNTVSVLLGNGDGTFQPQLVVPAGTRVAGATVADVNGDGKPDLILDNYAADTIWVLDGNGDGTFGAPTSYPTDDHGRFQGAQKATVADVNGDGIPDLIYETYVGADVVVRLGNGDGTFGPELKSPTAAGSYESAVIDVNGDGIPDVVSVNAVANTVSVLLGKGDGTFQPERTYAVGANPYSLAVADVNGDGKPDLLTSNRDDNTVSVLLGNGDGTFQAQRVVETGKTPRRVAAGDFNGDGHLDLVTANQGDNTASVLLGNGDGTFLAGSQAAPAPDLRPFQVAVADLNGDGRPDIVTANRSDNSVGVLLRNADGSLQTKQTVATGRQPFSVTVADVNGDGIPDLVTANYAGDSVSVLLGNGDGTFRTHVDYPAGSADYDVQVADVNGDHKPDIIVTDKNDNTVGVLLGIGDGTFAPMQSYPVASGPYEVVVKDVNHDGIPDLIVSHFSATVVDVLLGNGDGTFQPTRQFPVGSRPYGLAVADVNGDGNLDIVTANYRSANVSVLLGDGHGNFGSARLLPVGLAPNEVQVADLNGDGVPDLVTANYGGQSVSVLLGTGGGAFQPARSFPAGSGPASVAVADLNGDGIPDLVVGNRNASTIQVLAGNGDGTFQGPVSAGAGKNKYALALADVNGDGKADLVTVNVRQDAVTVQLGNGDGTFEPPQLVPVGPAPTSVVVADLNRDGRPDLVVTDSGANTVSVLLGNGDGSFQPPQAFAVGRSPRRAAVADLNGDGILDLVVANYDDNTVSVLLGNGDGTFQPQHVERVGAKPYAEAVADVNGDGKPDLVVANSAGDTVSVLLGQGDGTFGPQRTFATGRQPFGLAVADVNGDGKLDLITADAFDNTVSVLAGNGDGTFAAAQAYAVGARPYGVAVADVNGDGKPDLIATNYGGNSLSVLLGDGTGSFQTQPALATDRQPVQTVVADVNGDGRPDLVTVSNHDSAAGVLVGAGAGTFQPVTAASSVGLRDTPFLVDLNGDGTPDSLVLDRSGNLLYRQGLPGSIDAFAPPVVLNPGRPARDVALVHTGAGVAIAAADAHFDATLSTHDFVFAIALYRIDHAGAVERTTACATTALPVRLAAADLVGNGLDDLIAANSLDNSVTIALQVAPGQFAAPVTLGVGVTPSAVTAADVNGDGLPDVIVSDKASGDVAVLLNDAGHSFRQTLRFRADPLAGVASPAAVQALAQPVGVVAGNFTGTGRPDLVVVDAGSHRLVVLPATGDGFADPPLALTTATSDAAAVNNQPGAAVAGDFNGDGRPDLAVLMQDTGQLWVDTNNGDGTFRHSFTIPVGDQATGLSVVPGSGPGLLDLLVGNGFGDLLHLQGKGDGTFQITGNRVSLAVVPDLLGNGQAGVLVGNQADNRVTIQAPTASGTQFAAVQTLSAANASTQLAPGDVHWFPLERQATLPDPVVVSSGSNAVVVYRTLGVTNGLVAFAPAPLTFFVGTTPAAVTVADVNGDGVPDLLVANQGSNDISVIFGGEDAAGHWVGTPGPRLKSGGNGPLAVSVSNSAGGSAGLIVTNGDSGTVTELPGVGRGFFDDQHPRTLLDLGGALAGAPSFVGATGVGYAVTVGGALVRFNLDEPAQGAAVVLAGQHILVAHALADGGVVAARADGTVEVLEPAGAGLRITAVLQAQAGVPTLPSALAVLQRTNGQSEILVSSRGSDTLFVFAGAAASTAATASGTVAAARAVTDASPGASVIGVPVSTVVSATLAGLAAVGAGSAAGLGAAAATASVAAASVATSVLSEASATTAAASAMLVALQGNNYATVAVLDFDTDHAPAVGQAPRPDLATRYPLGDSSLLLRFLSGVEDAVQQFRAAGARLSDRLDESQLDPWREDLFYHRPLALPARRDTTPQLPLDDEPDDELGSPGVLEGPSAAMLWLALTMPGGLPSVAAASAQRGRRSSTPASTTEAGR